MTPVALIALMLVQAPSVDSLVLEGGARGPAFAADGRVAVEIRGDLWVLAPLGSDAAPIRITSGAAWDGDPAWTPAGDGLVFSSDRSGSLDLWLVAVGAGGAAMDPIRLTSSPLDESEPAVDRAGRIAFVRGAGSGADLWLLDLDASERALTTEAGSDRSPAFSPDGARIAYVRDGAAGRELRTMPVGEGRPGTVVDDIAAEHPAWSPDGARIGFTVRGRRGGVYLTEPGGSYVNLVAPSPGEVAWSPDGSVLLVASLPPEDPSYNGDPDRVGDRRTEQSFPERSSLRVVPVPLAPGAGEEELAWTARVGREEYNGAVFDRVWGRLAERYAEAGTPPSHRDRWKELAREHRDRALVAASEEELEGAIAGLLEARPPLRAAAAGRAAVSSAHPLATAAGLEVLRKGGNVVDAAVAVSFALGVVEPDASGIGGYGQMVLSLDGMEEPVVIDFLTKVPEAASLDNGSLTGPDGELPDDGPVLANVPGTVAGMYLAWERYGSGAVPWADLVEPARRLAAEGFLLDDAFPTTLARERERYLAYGPARDLFFPGGEPLEAGDTLRNRDLAWTLGEIARDGADAFYRGSVARRMVADLRGHGNAMTLEDLARYRAEVRRPVITTYRGHTVYGSAPPTSGGALLAGKLNLLELARLDGAGYDDAGNLHAMIQAWALAPSTAGRVADPALWPVDVTPFESKDTAAVRWACFRPDRVTSISRGGDLDGEEGGEVGGARVRGGPGCGPPIEAGDAPPDAIGEGPGDGDVPTMCSADPSLGLGACRAAGTTAFAVADASGSLVSVTQTLGTWGGNFYVTPGLGFLYNDKLRSYGTDPGRYNARVPFARNVTSISPTLVFRGTDTGRTPLLALGAAGNAWITSAVYQSLIGILDHGLDPQAALELPRFLVGGGGPGGGERVVQYEDGFHPATIRELRALGHDLQPISLRGELRMGYGAAVMVREGRALAGADPRRSGAAGAVGTSDPP